jgi:hypothetical protein
MVGIASGSRATRQLTPVTSDLSVMRMQQGNATLVRPFGHGPFVGQVACMWEINPG